MIPTQIWTTSLKGEYKAIQLETETSLDIQAPQKVKPEMKFE